MPTGLLVGFVVAGLLDSFGSLQALKLLGSTAVLSNTNNPDVNGGKTMIKQYTKTRQWHLLAYILTRGCDWVFPFMIPGITSEKKEAEWGDHFN